MRNSIALLCLALLPAVAVAANQDADQKQDSPKGPVTIKELAAKADYIGLLQVDDTHYETMRGIPSKGHAELKTLVTYRHPGIGRVPPGKVSVYEEGFGDERCYYPERRNEGRRFLAFLKKRKGKDGYSGTRPGCMLPVYVTRDNSYALRYPIPGLAIPDKSLVKKIQFADPDAFVEAGDQLSYARTESLVDQDLLLQTDDGDYQYTHGIYLRDLRPAIEAAKKPEETRSLP